MVSKKMSSHQLQTQRTSLEQLLPETIERMVREALNKVQLDTPAAAVESPVVGSQSSGQNVCNDCVKLSTDGRRIAANKRRTIGLSDNDCGFCGLASKPESYTKPFLDFLTENPTIFHAVDYFKTKLHDAGFTEVGPVVGQVAH